ncbi:reverse transcriptase domain-containing protein [Tanacetum coccineum]
MANQCTMAELLRAPTEGYAEAIVVPPILAEHFELKHSLINMMTSDQFFGLEKDNPHDHIRGSPSLARKEPPHSILTWEDLVSKFINEFFPPSRMTNLRNEISNFQQRFDESFHEAWDRYKDLLRACPHHGFTELHQLDTFYNALNPADQDSLNSAAGGNLLERRTQDVLTIIENKSKVRNSRNKSIVSQVKSSDVNSSSSSEIAKLTHAVNQQTSVVTTAMTAILKQFQATPPPASVKAVEEICVTCGGAHPYYQCLTADGNTFLEFQDNIQGYVSAAAVNYNQGNSGYRPPSVANQIRPSGFAQPNVQIEETISNKIHLIKLQFNKIKLSLPDNTIANPQDELKAITTRSGLILDGPSVPMPPLFINPKEDQRAEETLTDPRLAEYTIKNILRDGNDRLTLNKRHDTSSYSTQPHQELINMIDVYNVSHEEYREDLFSISHQGGNPTSSLTSHTDLTSPKVNDDIFNPEGDIIENLLNLDKSKDLPPYHDNPLSGNPTPISEPVTKFSSSSPTFTSIKESDLIWEESEAYLTSDSFPPGNSNPSSPLPPFHNSLSGSTTSSSPSLPIYETSDYSLEEFVDELAHFCISHQELITSL